VTKVLPSSQSAGTKVSQHTYFRHEHVALAFYLPNDTTMELPALNGSLQYNSCSGSCHKSRSGRYDIIDPKLYFFWGQGVKKMTRCRQTMIAGDIQYI